MARFIAKAFSGKTKSGKGIWKYDYFEAIDESKAYQQAFRETWEGRMFQGINSPISCLHVKRVGPWYEWKFIGPRALGLRTPAEEFRGFEHIRGGLLFPEAGTRYVARFELNFFGDTFPVNRYFTDTSLQGAINRAVARRHLFVDGVDNHGIYRISLKQTGRKNKWSIVYQDPNALYDPSDDQPPRRLSDFGIILPGEKFINLAS